jgi:ABC-type transporter Mla MlaB component
VTGERTPLKNRAQGSHPERSAGGREYALGAPDQMLRQEIVSENEIRLILSGPLYGEAATEFEKRLEGLCDGLFATITLDLSMAVGITSAAIAKLVSVQRRLRAQNKSIRINGCSQTLSSIFTKIKLDTLIPITP